MAIYYSEELSKKANLAEFKSRYLEQKKKGVRIKGPMPREIPFNYSGPARRAVPKDRGINS